MASKKPTGASAIDTAEELPGGQLGNILRAYLQGRPIEGWVSTTQDADGRRTVVHNKANGTILTLCARHPLLSSRIPIPGNYDIFKTRNPPGLIAREAMSDPFDEARSMYCRQTQVCDTTAKYGKKDYSGQVCMICADFYAARRDATLAFEAKGTPWENYSTAPRWVPPTPGEPYGVYNGIWALEIFEQIDRTVKQVTLERAVTLQKSRNDEIAVSIGIETHFAIVEEKRREKTFNRVVELWRREKDGESPRGLGTAVFTHATSLISRRIAEVLGENPGEGPVYLHMAPDGPVCYVARSSTEKQQTGSL